ncbi:MAG TPA: phosphate acetyltransferase [Rhodospirillaceae bacterium]|nr:phosphate acetyltransferase [Magnetovibrio sp.]HBT42161.1 phosphate acetyltransferase [Rhodospirillaceae bacterium]HCS69282.1 phosphate acetyltransferase [Rhodospirillaceae bacterium]|tara:strand:+ start:9768 stop:10697 length:930 start_codon:yes stop_codon:yes gene_type:complete
MLSTAPYEVPQYLLDRARGLPRVPMAIAGADNMVVMESARQATDAGLITPVLVGDRDEIESLAETMAWDISGFRIVETGEEDEAAAARMAVTLARDGEVQALMKGHVHTDALMAAVVARETGLRTGRRLSHVFHMTVPGSDRVLMITDGAVNVAPNENTLMDIVNNAVGLAHALGNAAPKVAILSGTESALPAMPSSMTAKAIVERARAGEVTGAVVDGPFAFDNAVSPEAARFKGIDSPVAGNADILVVPNIETGNGLFKMMVYFMSGLAAGVVLGAKVPIVLTSRADPPEARFAATAIAAIAAARGD